MVKVFIECCRKTRPSLDSSINISSNSSIECDSLRSENLILRKLVKELEDKNSLLKEKIELLEGEKANNPTCTHQASETITVDMCKQIFNELDNIKKLVNNDNASVSNETSRANIANTKVKRTP